MGSVAAGGQAACFRVQLRLCLSLFPTKTIWQL